MPAQLPPLPLSARANEAAVQPPLSGRALGSARGRGTAAAAAATGGAPQGRGSVAVPSLDLGKAVAGSTLARHGSTSRRIPPHTPSNRDHSRRHVRAPGALLLPPALPPLCTMPRLQAVWRSWEPAHATHQRACPCSRQPCHHTCTRRGPGTDSSSRLARGWGSAAKGTRSARDAYAHSECSTGRDVEEGQEWEEGEEGGSSYRSLVCRKLWFNDTGLHSAMLQVLLRLLVTPQGALDGEYLQVSGRWSTVLCCDHPAPAQTYTIFVMG